MKPILHRKFLVRIADVWPGGEVFAGSADLINFIGAEQPIDGSAVEEFHTLVITLLPISEQVIFDGMEKGTRYEIRRAQNRDDLKYECFDSQLSKELNDFERTYRRNAMRLSAEVKIDFKRLFHMARDGKLDLSLVRDKHGNIISWHVHFLTGRMARLLHSVSLISGASNQESKNLRGRANRLHHWEDMKRFRKGGIESYDFGGYYMGQDDEKKLAINRFKRGFGGEVKCTYNCLYPANRLGRMALGLRKRFRGRQ